MEKEEPRGVSVLHIYIIPFMYLLPPFCREEFWRHKLLLSAAGPAHFAPSQMFIFFLLHSLIYYWLLGALFT